MDYTTDDVNEVQKATRNLLLSTYISKMEYKGKPRHQYLSDDYKIIHKNYKAIKNSLSAVGFELFSENDFYYVKPMGSYQKLIRSLSVLEERIAFILRLLYARQQEKTGQFEEVQVTVGDVYYILTEEFPISKKCSNSELGKVLSWFDKHNLIKRKIGEYNEGDCKFDILSSICVFVSTEKMIAWEQNYNNRINCSEDETVDISEDEENE